MIRASPQRAECKEARAEQEQSGWFGSRDGRVIGDLLFVFVPLIQPPNPFRSVRHA